MSEHNVDPISEYRQSLLNSEQQMQSEYDKAVMTLSGGALGISMTFLKDFVLQAGIQEGKYLIIAWIFWGLSIICTLSSFYSSTLAFRKAIRQTDENKIYSELQGGCFQWITNLLNASSGICFFLGVISFTVFAFYNIKW
jgi:hypothetical protein